MKKLLVSLLALTVLASVSSCKKEKDPQEEPRVPVYKEGVYNPLMKIVSMTKNGDPDQDWTWQGDKLDHITWIGGEDENPNDNIPMLLTDELISNGIEITLVTPGANFRLPAAGSYYVRFVANDRTYLDDFLVVDNTETSISNLNPSFSYREGVSYDLRGQRVQPMANGLYIINGKKVIKK